MPQSRRFGPWGWIAERAQAADSLALPERRLVLPLDEFNKHLGSVRNQFQGRPSFKPLVAYIDELRSGLEEGIGWIQEYVEGDLPYGELEERLREDTAEALENLLDAYPSLFRHVPAGLPSEIDTLVEDVETMVEEICDEISHRGYELHGFLIGAA